MDRKLINRRYRIERQIGEGAAAEVYLAQDSVLNRKVALKSLRPQFAADPSFRVASNAKRKPPRASIIRTSSPFSMSAKIAVCRISSWNTSTAKPCAPSSTRKRRSTSTMSPFWSSRSRPARLCAPARPGPSRHQPHNILVDQQGLAKVVDFGIAKGLSDEALTDAAESIGTVQYISPEQASGLMATPNRTSTRCPWSHSKC